ncbi:MAG TPA: PQQ-dependent sugar dehydrogenase [Solirubrobacterales bacterium]
MRGWIAAFVAALALAVLPGAASGAALVPLAPSSAWLSDPIHATAPPGDSRLFVAERGGGIRIFENGALRPTPFLTVPNVDAVNGERGLLSIAFPPDYAFSGFFYVFVVQKETEGAVRVLQYQRSAVDPNLADPASERIVLEVPHASDDVHYGGQIAFGPDEYLYVTIGEAGVPANAQDKTNLLGKVLRIDPLPGGGYEIPPSNPFSGAVDGTRKEIFALGLRNPYRASFAPNGALVVPDVGSNIWEEVNTGNLAAANLGWPICEGACAPPNPALTDPFFQYGNDSADPGPETATGCAIVGGHVVRDQPLGELLGRYLYGDFCRSDLRTIDLGAAGGDPRPAGLTIPSGSLLGFGEDSGCGVYVMTTGTAYRVAINASSPPSSGAPLCAIVDPVGKPPQREPLGLRVRAARRQRLRGHVKVTAICSQACELRARGRLHFFKRGRKAGSARLIPVSRPAKAGTRNHFRLAVLKVRVRQRAKRLLKQGGRVSAQVTVIAFDDAGDRVLKTVPVRLIR